MINLNKSRIGFVDAMKGIAIILMIFNHVPLEGRQWWRLIEVFHMPLFFLLSGYLYKQKTFREVFFRNVKKILIPYFITCLVVWFIQWVYNHDPLWGVSILIGNGKGPMGYEFQYQVGPLWFLPAFFVSMMIINLLIKIESERIRWAVLLGLFTVSYLQVRTMDWLLPFGLTTGVGGAVFVYLGIFVKSHPQLFINLKYRSVGLFVWFVCVCIGKLAMSWHIYGLFIFQFVGGVYGTYICYIFVMSFRQDSCLWRALCFIGSNTLAILCIHSVDRILGISTLIAEWILKGSENEVMIWQLDVAIKYIFVIVGFGLFCLIPGVKNVYQIKIK